MKISYGTGKTPYGPGVSIDLGGEQVALAIEAYVVAHGAQVHGPRTVTVNGELCSSGRIYVDPSGSVDTWAGIRFDGRGLSKSEEAAAQPAPPPPPAVPRGILEARVIDRIIALEEWQKRLAPDGSPCLEERLHAIEGRLVALLDRVLEVERLANSPETAPVEHTPGDLVVGRGVTPEDHNNLVRDLADQGMSIYRRLDLQRQDIEGLRQHLDVVQNHLGMGDIRHDGESPLRLERIEKHLAALEDSRAETTRRLDAMIEDVRESIRHIGDIKDHLGLRLTDAHGSPVPRLTVLADRVAGLEGRLRDHINSHKRLFPGSLGPNPEPVSGRPPKTWHICDYDCPTPCPRAGR